MVLVYRWLPDLERILAIFSNVRIVVHMIPHVGAAIPWKRRTRTRRSRKPIVDALRDTQGR